MKTMGTVTAYQNGLVVECEPHVMVRLKRVFNKIDKREIGCVGMSLSPENAHDLLWFIERYPMEMNEKTAEILRAGREAYLTRQQMVMAALDAGYEPRQFDLAIPARPYQAVAADLLHRSRALLCADQVGLGKTLIGIAGFTDPAALPALVVTLTSLPRQWKEQIGKFTPSIRTHILQKGSPYPLPQADVYISNYHKLHGWAETLGKIIKYVIFDEAQELRKSNSFKYSAAMHLSACAEWKLMLTATPIYNYWDEIYNVLNCLKPGVVGTWMEFSREWSREGSLNIKDPKALGSYLRREGLMIRRTRAEVGRELPPCTTIPITVDADADRLKEVAASASALAKIILAKDTSTNFEKFRAGGELDMLLRQATGVAKAPYVAAFVEVLLESEEKVILYGWHHAVYDIWERLLEKYDPVFFTGRQTPLQKEESRRKFISGPSRVMILSLRAGAGLDGLQHVCRSAVVGELDWSPGVHEQCIGRIFRDGQTQPVMAYFPLSAEGSDPIVADVCGVKMQQSTGIIDPNAELTGPLEIDPNHIRRLAEAYLKQGKETTDENG